MKLIIAGGRNFGNWETVKRTIDYFLSETDDKDIEIVSGRCSDKKGVHTFTTSEGIKVYGADGLGEKYALLRGYKVRPFPADWDRYGGRAGPIRNREMAKYGTHAVVYWDVTSRGSRDMIAQAKQYKCKLKIVRYDKL